MEQQQLPCAVQRKHDTLSYSQAVNDSTSAVEIKLQPNDASELGLVGDVIFHNSVVEVVPQQQKKRRKRETE